jgi:hypothetical protein
MYFRNESKSTLVLNLTGGLGNQLFQIAAALYSTESKTVSVEWVFGRPRVNHSNLPQIECFELPAQIHLLRKSRDSWVARKTLGYLLRSSVEPKWFEKSHKMSVLAKLIGSLVLLVKTGKYRSITTGNNIGFYPLSVNSKRRYLLGYFQSYKYSDNKFVMDTLKNFRVKNFQNYTKYIEMAKLEEPLVVHVRLSDYREEDKFGIPEKQYYHESITNLWETGKYKSIWLFSDEPENALDRIPSELQAFIRSFGDIENCIAKTLEVMRLGKGYVIANSSFSWWGARLSRTIEPVVVAPRPWFRHLIEPEDLIPPGWIRKNAWDFIE